MLETLHVPQFISKDSEPRIYAMQKGDFSILAVAPVDLDTPTGRGLLRALRACLNCERVIPVHP
jgi:hypothetical protein